jgi:hypothetical protein
VVFLDEIDALRDAVLLSVLRQIRSGYDNRPGSFPASLALVGLRDVRDDKVAAGGSDRLNTSSTFNIKARSLSMREFTADEVAELLAQHTADTGQRFEHAAVARGFELTQGQPWLVNALAAALTQELVADRARPVTADDVDRAKELLIARLGVARGWLVRFDQRTSAAPLPDRVSVEERVSPRGLAVTVIGL